MSGASRCLTKAYLMWSEDWCYKKQGNWQCSFQFSFSFSWRGCCGLSVYNRRSLTWQLQSLFRAHSYRLPANFHLTIRGREPQVVSTRPQALVMAPRHIDLQQEWMSDTTQVLDSAVGSVVNLVLYISHKGVLAMELVLISTTVALRVYLE